MTAAILVSIPIGSFSSVDFSTLWPYILVSLLPSLIGVFCGFKLSRKLSPIALSLFIGIVLIIGGTVATVENFVLHRNYTITH